MVSRRTEVEKEKFIDLLFDNNDKQMSELVGLRLEIESLNRESQKTDDVSSR